MHDYFLLLTPLLTLLVVALVGFVGCDALFGLDHVPDEPTAVRNLQGVADNNAITLTWEKPLKGDPSGYAVKRGEMSGDYTLTQPAGNALSFTDMNSIMNNKTYYYVVAGLYSGIEKGPSNEVAVVAGGTGVTDLVTGVMPGAALNSFTGFLGMGFTVGSAPLVVKTLGRYKIPGNFRVHVVKLVVAGPNNVDVPNGSVTIDLGNPTYADNEFAHVALPSPITLNPNTDYYLVSEEANQLDQWYDSAGTQVTTVPGIVSRVYAVNIDTAGNANPGTANNFVYVPVDLQF